MAMTSLLLALSLQILPTTYSSKRPDNLPLPHWVGPRAGIWAAAPVVGGGVGTSPRMAGDATTTSIR